MPARVLRRRGLTAAAVLAAYVISLFPLWAQAASGQDQQQLALLLFNTQSCAQHYTDNAVTVAQATATAAPPATPGPPNVPPGVSNGTYTLNPTPH
ncbi:MAG: hypothetical protein ACLQHL_12015, partial [Candidatus Cybelea sp.]